MTGRILGYDNSSNEGTISADNGSRYKFSKEEWRDNSAPQKEMKVDFEIDDNNAKDIYVVKDQAVESNTMVLGLAAVAITFFFGFIGTLVSRLFLAKQSFGESLVPTAIHFVLTLLVLIPILGWFIYMVGTVYYMYKNYMLITNPDN